MIHGDQLPLRRVAAAVIARVGGEKRALRYALCGRGDRIVVGENGGYGVQPSCCGSRVCPRCHRKRGAVIARRCIAWLGAEAHGWLYSFTLTQRVDATETLPQAKKRMEGKVALFLKSLRGAGMRGGLLTVHIVWSESAQGWHYHVHGVAEMVNGWELTDFARWWQEACARRGEEDGFMQGRVLACAGPAMSELAADGGDLDFWREAASDAARAVQYPVRDMLQGVSAWRLGGDAQMEEAIEQLLRHAASWKCHRSLGRWRQGPPVVPSADEVPPDDGPGKAPTGTKTSIGTVDGVYRQAIRGDRGCRYVMRQLELGCANEGEFAKRLVEFCRRAWWRPHDGS